MNPAKLLPTTLATFLLGMEATSASIEPPPSRVVHVSPRGDDHNNGDESSPFRTLTRGLKALTAPGDVLEIHAGTYHEGDFTPKVNGRPDLPITVRARAGHKVVVDGKRRFWSFLALRENDGWVIEGLELCHFRSAGIDARHVGYVTIRRMICHANGAAGISLNYASYPHADYDAHLTVEDNICYENGWGDGWASGIHLNNKGEGGGRSHHVIRRNVCFNNVDASSHRTDGNGIMFDVGGGGTARIESNLVFDNGGAGIRVMDGVATILYNTCYRNGWDDRQKWQAPELQLIERHRPDSIRGSVVRHNILWCRTIRPDQRSWLKGPFDAGRIQPDHYEFDHNLLWSDDPRSLVLPSPTTHCVLADPRFPNPTRHDRTTTRHQSLFLDVASASLTSLHDLESRFGLTSASPARAAGQRVPTPPPSAPPELDLLHRPRSPNSPADLGAFVFSDRVTRP
ncbi:hypothetical protein Isop_2459 [Isosphaera pallida ATCC 43644]|uniref:Right handed beta helix domain-containing protein n=1 Tax=Isosphaera pallida (strain ATCC 43644 / DSM 9630 / IS1B) TaxID=575540 RepID=E8QXI5_ISOPI|nr:right-handed parallel beta-helix repeat-containing protein [Isosphaera pallida]ADV63033.1 hypothetical protein Isop_2459 [Isosphaera pallida ATCC 43644]